MRRGPKYKLNKHREQINAWLNDGKTYKQIAQELGCDRDTVSRFCKREELSKPKVDRSGENITGYNIWLAHIVHREKVRKYFRKLKAEGWWQADEVEIDRQLWSCVEKAFQLWDESKGKFEHYLNVSFKHAMINYRSSLESGNYTASV